MSGWVFLSKGGEDEYVNMLAASAKMQPMDSDHFDYHYDIAVDQNQLVLRGILKHKIMKQCLEDGNNFYYIDSGYVGNNVRQRERETEGQRQRQRQRQREREREKQSESAR